ncbi:MAG: hypothetical protein RIF32_03590 [Leptospirales bacterium]|jgi:hypothetical protein
MQELTEKLCIESVAWAIRLIEKERTASPRPAESIRERFYIAEHHCGLTSAMGLITAHSGGYNIDFDNQCDCCGEIPQAGTVDIELPVVAGEGAEYSDNVISAGKYIFEKLGGKTPTCSCNREWGNE